MAGIIGSADTNISSYGPSSVRTEESTQTHMPSINPVKPSVNFFKDLGDHIQVSNLCPGMGCLTRHLSEGFDNPQITVYSNNYRPDVLWPKSLENATHSDINYSFFKGPLPADYMIHLKNADGEESLYSYDFGSPNILQQQVGKDSSNYIYLSFIASLKNLVLAGNISEDSMGDIEFRESKSYEQIIDDVFKKLKLNDKLAAGSEDFLREYRLLKDSFIDMNTDEPIDEISDKIAAITYSDELMQIDIYQVNINSDPHASEITLSPFSYFEKLRSDTSTEILDMLISTDDLPEYN